MRVGLPDFRSSFFQLSIAAFGAVFLVVSVGFAALGREIHPEGTIPPGVYIAGASVGEMETDEAHSKLEEHVAEFSSNPLTIVYGDQTWSPTMSDLGAEFDLSQSLDDASFEHSRLERMRVRLFGHERTDVPLRLRIDQDRLESYVAGIAEEIDRPPQIPELTLSDAGITLSDAQIGLETRQASLVEEIHYGLYSLDSSPVQVEVAETEPDFDDGDVELIKGMVHDALGGPLTIWFEDQSWSIEPDQLIEFLTLNQSDEGDVELGFNEDELIPYLDGIIGNINRAPRNAQIAWGGESVVATSPSQNGIERDLYGTIPRLEEAIAHGEQDVELAYNVLRPSIDSENLGDLGIDGFMAQGESAFWNSAPSRAHNIAVAAGYLDGTIIPPGHEFSFNQAVGEISPERGYQEGYVIQAEETVPGVGGGVCQVSTTVFRAAFFSGLPITERHPHAYIVGFYEQGNWPLGFDAAIFQPDVDFRFVNTTDSYMLMHTHVADGHLYVNLYGPDLGYSVELGEPTIENRTDPPPDVEILDESLAPGERRQVEDAKPGMEVTLPRTVTNRDGEVVRQDYFYSNFQAWGNRFLVGPSPNVDAQDPEDAPAPEAPSGEIIEEEVEEPEEQSD